MALTLNMSDYFRVRAFCYMQNQASVNTFDFQVAAVTGAPSAALILDALSTAAAPVYKQWIATLAKYEGMKVTVIRGATKYQTIMSVAGAGTGLPGSDPHPKQIAGLSTKVTDFGGRAYRGRVYWPFPARDVADLTGMPSPAQVAAMSALGSVLLLTQTLSDGTNTATLQPVLYHKNAAIAPTPILQALVSQKWATQRRRGDYGRPNLTML